MPCLLQILKQRNSEQNISKRWKISHCSITLCDPLQSYLLPSLPRTNHHHEFALNHWFAFQSFTHMHIFISNIAIFNFQILYKYPTPFLSLSLYMYLYIMSHFATCYILLNFWDFLGQYILLQLIHLNHWITTTKN